MSLPRAALEQAIEWTAVLRDEPLPANERQAFERWLGADPAHPQAWARVQQHLHRSLAPLTAREAPARQALQAPRPSRRHFLRGALVLAGVGITGVTLTRQGMPLAELGADLRTGTGERLSRDLADGSHLQLDARSAVDIDFNDRERRLVLRAGKLIVSAQADPRPLRIVTPFGSVQTFDGQCMVANHAQCAHVWVMRSSVTVDLPGGSQHVVVKADHGVRLGQAIEALAASGNDESSWQNGFLNVVDWPLGDVITALQPYRRGVLRITPQAARLRVSGLFSLDHSDRALAALEQTMPVRVQRYFDWWVSVDAV